MENSVHLKNKGPRLSSLWKSGVLLIMTLTCLSGCNLHSVKDVEGNKYKTVKIGHQIWMAENLKTTRFNDGTPVSPVTNYDSWAGMTTPAYSWYNNDSVSNNEYGVLYNWYTVASGKLCPVGWHIPTEKEWFTLSMYLMVPEMAGGTLKEPGTAHWRNPNTGANNKTGFSALGGGYRSNNGSFNYIMIGGYWWSSSPSNRNAYFSNLYYKSGAFSISVADKANGYSVRCIKD